MVRLGPSDSSINSVGAQYMADNRQGAAVVGGGVHIHSDDDVLLDPVLTSTAEGGSQKLKTVPAFSIHLAISTTISLVGIGLAAWWSEGKRCEAYFIMLYLRAAFWVITFIFDHIVKARHHDIRLQGYHEFYRATAMHKGIPLQVVSLWNTILLAVQAMIHHYYGETFWEHCIAGFLSPIAYVTAFNIAETIVLALTHSCYIGKVVKFNRSVQPPDALRGGNSTSGSLGLMQSHVNYAELLEKQADLIDYLKDHNQKLNQKLHQMQLNTRTINITH